MGTMTEVDREQLERIAREMAARNAPSYEIEARLRRYCLDNGLEPVDSDLFVFAEVAIVNQMELAKIPVPGHPMAHAPRETADRRKYERRQGNRRGAGRRQTGLTSLLEDVKHLGRSERRANERRSGASRRERLRRTHVRRRANR